MGLRASGQSVRKIGWTSLLLFSTVKPRVLALRRLLTNEANFTTFEQAGVKFIEENGDYPTRADLCPPLTQSGRKAYPCDNKKMNIFREKTMYSRALLVVVNLAFAIPLSGAALAQTPATALTGLVSSAENDVMEGVLVSASKMGSPVTVTVVTGKDGRFTFPASKLAQGQYSLGVRVIGYELDAHKAIEITEQKTTTLDLKLRKTEDLAAQLSNGEWLASIPGTDQQKGQLLNCVGCHTLERIVRSKYDAEAFLTQFLPRMQGYVNQSIPAHPQLRRAERLMEERGDQRVQVYRAAADYLSTINLSTGSQWSYPLKTFARPAGRATHVISTEYDLPRETISPHDVIVDADGIVWYSSFGEQNLGRLDPKTGKVTEYPIPVHKADFPTGGLGLRDDNDGNLWLGNMYQATIVKLTARRSHSNLRRCHRAEHRCLACQYGEPAKLACRRQSLDTEQRICRSASSRRRYRQDRNVAAVEALLPMVNRTISMT